jgi:hypothetical protein
MKLKTEERTMNTIIIYGINIWNVCCFRTFINFYIHCMSSLYIKIQYTQVMDYRWTVVPALLSEFAILLVPIILGCVMPE